MKRIAGLSFAALAVATLFSSSAFALQRTWGNTGTDYNASASWNAGAGPAPGAGDVGAFTAAEVTQPNVSASLSNAGVFFNAVSGYDLTNSAGAVLTLTGNAATAGGSESSNSSAAAIGSTNTSGTNTVDASTILAPASGSTLVVTQTTGGTLIINGSISSAAGIDMSLKGGGTIQLNGSNSVGTASIDSASEVVVLGNDGALGNGAFSINSSSTLQAGGGARTIANNIVFAGTTTIGGSNAFTFNGNASTSGANSRTVTVNNTALTTFGGTTTINGNTNVGTLVVNGTGNATFNGTIVDGSFGTSILSHGGTGTFTLANANTYSGGTLMSGGLTIANHDGAFGSGNVSLTAGNVTLTLQSGALNNYIANSAAFSLFDSTDTVNLNFTGTEVVNTLTVALAGEAAGVYGSATSGAPNVLPEFTGTGTITVLTSAVPEPSTLAMIAIGAASLIGAQIRRKRS